MNRSDESPTTVVTSQKRLSMPLTVLISLVVTTAAGYAAWSSTRDEVARQGRVIQELQIETRTTREILIRIDENVKDLRRSERSGTPLYNTR